MTFVLRISLDEVGRPCGVLERVRSGAKARFRDLEELTALIARVVTAESENLRGDEAES